MIPPLFFRSIAFAFLFLLFVPLGAGAENEVRSYSYQDIDVAIQVNENATFDVVENQWFAYQGEYHQGYRSIPLRKIDAITGARVIDGDTGNALIYSPKRLNKLDPNSWGKYTYYRENGAINIEWYYNLKDTEHHWKLAYTVYGGVAFYDAIDEIYWNILTDYDVPVKHSRVSIVLPRAADMSKMQMKEYLTGGATSSSYVADERTFVAEAWDLQPHAAFTVAAGWPKGIVDQGAYYMDFVKIYWGYIASLLVLIITVITVVAHWFFTEKFRKGRGVIIAQYDPPKKLPPAIGEVIVKEAISKNTWAATIVDLAVRGLIGISEDEKTKWEKLVNTISIGFMPCLYGGLLVYVIFMVIRTIGFQPLLLMDFFLHMGIIIILFLPVFLRLSKAVPQRKDYTLTLKDKGYHQQMEKYGLKAYEVDFLEVLFPQNDVFSTKKVRSDVALSRRVYAALKKTEKKLYEDLAKLGVYANDMVREGKWKAILIGGGIGLTVFMMIIFSQGSGINILSVFSPQGIIFLFTMMFCVMILVYRILFDARLNQEGNEFREEWLGFKLYLETAERYRMQNLTPDIFEKYLPYAMIFSIEKKWAKAFESIGIQQPEWYSGGVAHSSGFSSASFSATGFAAGLSASLASSMSSAGAGGSASGGGGGAGGGGGGGGGGAS